MIVNNALTVAGEYTLGERFSYAGEMTLLGMLMIFAVLGVLWGILAMFKVVFSGSTKKVKTKAPDAVASAVAEAAAASAEVEVAPVAVAESSDEELVAILTAAVAAYMGSEEAPAFTGGFRVVSFRRVGTGRSWNSNK